MALEDTDMGAQAWAAWTTPQHASDPMPAQKVAQLEGHQNEFARALGEAMRKLGRQHHPWVAEQDLPPEQQFFYKWFHHYAQRGVNSDAWPSVNVTNHWVQTTGALYTQGWEDEYTDRVFNCRAISSPEEALTLLAHVDIHKKSRLDGIDGCNALHRLARFSERDYSTNILEALHQTRFQDSPNQVGEWGTQAMLSRYVEMNNRAAAVRLFARQLPLKIDGPAETHPFALLAEEVRTKNKDHATADALLAAMHVGLPNVSLAFNRLNTESILNYGIYKGDANLVLAALKSGDRFEGRNRRFARNHCPGVLEKSGENSQNGRCASRIGNVRRVAPRAHSHGRSMHRRYDCPFSGCQLASIALSPRRRNHGSVGEIVSGLLQKT